MVNFVILFLLFLAYVVSAMAGAGSEFSLFVIFVALAVIALRRWNAAGKDEEHWRQLNARITGVELNQQQLRKSFQELTSVGAHAPAAHEVEHKPQPEPAVVAPVVEK